MSAKEADQVRDTEITLSTGKLLGIFFALAIICGVFFTMGYLLGKSTSAGGRTEIVATVPAAARANLTPAIKLLKLSRRLALPDRPTARLPNHATQAHPPSLLISHQRPNNHLAARHQIKAPRNLRALMVKMAQQAHSWCRWQPYQNRKMRRSWLRRFAKSSIQSSSLTPPATPCSMCRLAHSLTGKMLKPCALVYLAMAITRL